MAISGGAGGAERQLGNLTLEGKLVWKTILDMEKGRQMHLSLSFGARGPTLGERQVSGHARGQCCAVTQLLQCHGCAASTASCPRAPPPRSPAFRRRRRRRPQSHRHR